MGAGPPMLGMVVTSSTMARRPASTTPMRLRIVAGVVVRVTDGEVLSTAPGVGGCALSAGGDHVAWTTHGSPTARVQSLRGGGASSSAVNVGAGYVQASALSPDGSLFATSDGSTVTVRDVRGGAAARVLAPSVRVDAMAFSPDGSLLVSTSQDRTLHLWDTRTGESLAVLQVEGADPSFPPDGRTLIVGDVAKTLNSIPDDPKGKSVVT